MRLSPLVAMIATLLAVSSGLATGSVWPFAARAPATSTATMPRLAQAEPASGAEPATPAAPAAPAPAPEQRPSTTPDRVVDETALRYFASQGDQKRLEQEIARLRALYPDWSPPADPANVAAQPDQRLDALWKLYAEGKFAEMRKQIADTQAADPAWTPPADLLDRLAIAESREQLVNASDLKQYETVVRVASANPSLLTCADVDILWRVAEAFASSDRRQRASDAYLYILKSCDDASVRLATVQKAAALIPRADLDALLATERKAPDGTGEFAAVRLDLARGSLATAGSDPKLVVAPSDLAQVEAVANQAGKASDALLLGWYQLRRSNPEAAERWFATALSGEKSATAAQGLALAMIEQGRPLEAEATLYEWRTADDETRAVYMAAVANLLAVTPPMPLDAERLQRMVVEIAAARDPAAAQELGWYADGLNQYQTAALWFAAALSWKADDEPSAYGLALMRWRLGDKAGVAAVQRAWAGRSSRIANVGKPEPRPGRKPVDSRGMVEPRDDTTSALAYAETAPPPTDTRESPARAPEAAPRQARRATPVPRSTGCATTMDPKRFSPDAAAARGWCLLELNRPLEAAAAFDVGLGSASERVRQDAAYGQSLAYIRAGMTDHAAAAAAAAPQSASRSVELQSSMLSAEAVTAFKAGHFTRALFALDERARLAPERIDLLVLRGYAYLRLRRFGDAERVFRAVAGTGDGQGARGLSAVKDARSAKPGTD